MTPRVFTGEVMKWNATAQTANMETQNPASPKAPSVVSILKVNETVIKMSTTKMPRLRLRRLSRRLTPQSGTKNKPMPKPQQKLHQPCEAMLTIEAEEGPSPNIVVSVPQTEPTTMAKITQRATSQCSITQSRMFMVKTARGANSRFWRRSHCAVKNWWEQRDLNPPQRISSETAHQMGSLQDCNGSALQLVINFSKPTRRHSRATGARDTTKLYYTPVLLPSASVLGLSACTLSASQLLLAPLPTLVAGFLPST